MLLLLENPDILDTEFLLDGYGMIPGFGGAFKSRNLQAPVFPAIYHGTVHQGIMLRRAAFLAEPFDVCLVR